MQTQAEAEQADARAEQALGLPVGRAEHRSDRERRQDGQRRLPRLATPGPARLMADGGRGRVERRRSPGLSNEGVRQGLRPGRTGFGPANMAVVKRMALNLLHQAKPAISLKNCRKRAGRNTDHLAQVSQQAT